MLGAFATSREKKQKVDELHARFSRLVGPTPELTASEVVKAREEGEDIILVDVRPEVERSVSTIGGAVTLDELDKLDRWKGGERKVVCFCTVGYRSGKETKRLLSDHPSAKVYNMRGSLLAWLFEQQRVVDGDNRETNRVHTYNRTFAVVPNGIEAVY